MRTTRLEKGADTAGLEVGELGAGSTPQRPWARMLVETSSSHCEHRARCSPGQGMGLAQTPFTSPIVSHFSYFPSSPPARYQPLALCLARGLQGVCVWGVLAHHTEPGSSEAACSLMMKRGEEKT